jgi:hypothetical protein
VTEPDVNPGNEAARGNAPLGHTLRAVAPRSAFQFQIWHVLVLMLAAGLYFWMTRKAGILVSGGPLPLIVVAVGVRVAVKLAHAFQDRAAHEQNPGAYSPFDQRRQRRSPVLLGVMVAFVSALILTAVILVIMVAVVSALDASHAEAVACSNSSSGTYLRWSSGPRSCFGSPGRSGRCRRRASSASC